MAKKYILLAADVCGCVFPLLLFTFWKRNMSVVQELIMVNVVRGFFFFPLSEAQYQLMSRSHTRFPSFVE